MSEYNKTILTNQGLDLMARANKGTARFAITRAATSTEQLTNKSMADLQQLTELPSLMQYGVINNVDDSYQDSNVVIGVELVFNNQDLANGYNINTIGLFAKEDGQDKEILYAITTAIAPEFMPDYKNKVLFKFSLTMFVAVGRTDNVSVIVDDSNSATKADLTKVKKELDGKANVGDVYSKTEINEKLNQAGKLKKISVNGGVPVEPDAAGVANIVLPDLNHPDYTITTSPFDLDLAINLGIYRLNGVDLTTSKRVDALTALPSNAIKGTKGFLIQKHYNDYYNMQILVLYDMPNDTDTTWAFRCIGIGSSEYRDTFKRITTDIDYTTLLNQVNQKANTNDVYTKFQTDNRLSLKANTSDIYTRSQIDNRLGYKANASDVYTQSQIDNKLASISVGGDIDAINRKLGDKANVSDVYSKSQSDSKFGGAIKKIDGYSPDSSGNMNLGNTYATINSVNKKANISDIYTQSQIDNRLGYKANASDVYSKSQADSKFGGAIKNIDGYYPDSQGRYYLANTYETINNVSIKLKKKLSNLSNPDYSYTGTTLDVDNIANPGVYFFEKTKLSSSMNSHTFDDVLSLPYNCGYLIVDDCYFISTRCQAQFLLNFNLNNPAISIYVRLIMPGAGAYGTKFKAIVS